MRLKTILAFYVLVVFPCLAGEQDVFLTMDFVLKAGTSQSRTFKIHTPKDADQLVMVGFNPVTALSVDCTLRLYGPFDKVLGTYRCNERQNHSFKTALPMAPIYNARIEVTNSNFTTASLSFSVTNRFKFVSSG